MTKHALNAMVLFCTILVSTANAGVQGGIDLVSQANISQVQQDSMANYDTNVLLFGPRLEIKADDALFLQLSYLKSTPDYEIKFDEYYGGTNKRNETKSVIDLSTGYIFPSHVGFKIGASLEQSEGNELITLAASTSPFYANYDNKLSGGRLGLVFDIPVEETPCAFYGGIDLLLGWREDVNRKQLYEGSIFLSPLSKSYTNNGVDIQGGVRMLVWNHLNFSIQANCRMLRASGEKNHKQTSESLTMMLGGRF